MASRRTVIGEHPMATPRIGGGGQRRPSQSKQPQSKHRLSLGMSPFCLSPSVVSGLRKLLQLLQLLLVLSERSF